MTQTTALIRLPVATALALLGGLALAAAFPPVGVHLLAPVGVALITTALWGARFRRGAGLGFLSGLAFFTPLLHWMTVIGTDAWLLLSAECAAWSVIIGLGTTVGSRLPLPPLWIAASWVLAEAIRGRWPWGGFPWGSLSFSQPDAVLGAWAPVAGTAMVTFVIAFVGACLTTVAVQASQGRFRRAAITGLLLAAVAALPAALGPWATPAQSDRIASIAVIQGGTPQTGMGAMDVRRAVLENHVAQTLDLAAAIDAGEQPRPDVVLWPENSTDIDPFVDSSVAADITSAARAVGAPIVVGAVTTVPDDPERVWNVGILWDPTIGPTQMYIKNRPVPFGEFIPFREQLAPLIGRFDRVPRDFAPGSRPGVLDVNGVVIGDVICFEIAYGDVVESVVDGGAQVITVQTNNATYAGTAQPEQQLDIERMRALETGRYVVVAATTGISAVIDPDGSVVRSMGEGEQAWFVADVPLVDDASWSTDGGRLVEWLILLVAIAAPAIWMLRTRARRDSGPDATEPPARLSEHIT